MLYIFLLSGPLAVGKSNLRMQFEARFGALQLSTSVFLKSIGNTTDRKRLIELGLEQDQKTDGKWVLQSVYSKIEQGKADSVFLVDAVRTERQVFHFREQYGSRVIHVHLTAPLEVLRQRYKNRNSLINEFRTYDEAAQLGTERDIGALANIADVVIDTNLCEPNSLLARATAGLGLFPLQPEPCVDVLIGAQYGSEGKGNICAHIAKDYQVLMRVGGPNAGHKVAHPKYDYIQLPSGTQANPQAKVLIGAGATLSIEQVTKEIKDLELTPERLSIDPQAMIIELSDCQQEQETMEVIGSTKKGVGVATARKILGRDGEEYHGSRVRLAREINMLEPFIRCTKTELEKAYALGHHVLLEGTQGTDLSIHHGRYPYVTSRETTASGCLADAGIAPTRVRKVIMVMRTYPIRVGGTSGDMAHEIDLKTIAERSGIPEEELRKIEVGTVSGKPRRVGEFDWDQVRRAASINGITDIALTFADYINVENRKAQRFEQLTEETRAFIAEVECVTNAPISLIAKDFGRHAMLIDRRTWR